MRGQVQMVGFRFFVVEQARRLGLTGWVRNGDDGCSVEVIAEGGDEALQELEAALHSGPPHANVESVDATWADETEGFSSFEVRY